MTSRGVSFEASFSRDSAGTASSCTRLSMRAMEQCNAMFLYRSHCPKPACLREHRGARPQAYDFYRPPRCLMFKLRHHLFQQRTGNRCVEIEHCAVAKVGFAQVTAGEGSAIECECRRRVLGALDIRGLALDADAACGRAYRDEQRNMPQARAQVDQQVVLVQRTQLQQIENTPCRRWLVEYHVLFERGDFTPWFGQLQHAADQRVAVVVGRRSIAG